ncbi:hypothetical protein HDU97_005917 [Phlyctochytrium planicorne]|nr:hypothetical protein HDU97_005917 [Phlyctochytrium planicorne]
MPTIVVFGATGRLGSFVVDDLLNGPFDDGTITIVEKSGGTRPSVVKKPFQPVLDPAGNGFKNDVRIKMLVRNPGKLPANVRDDGRVEVFEGDSMDVGDVGKVLNGSGVDVVLVTVGAADANVTTIVSDTVLAVVKALAALREKKNVHLVLVTSLGINHEKRRLRNWYGRLLKPWVMYHTYVDLEVAQEIVWSVAREGVLPRDRVLGRLKLRNVVGDGGDLRKGLVKVRKEVDGRVGLLTCTVVQPPQLLAKPGLGRNHVEMAVDGDVALLDCDNGTPVQDSAALLADVVRNVGGGEGGLLKGRNCKVGMVEKVWLEGNGLTPQARKLVGEWVGMKVRKVGLVAGVVAAVAVAVAVGVKIALKVK